MTDLFKLILGILALRFKARATLVDDSRPLSPAADAPVLLPAQRLLFLSL
jgi:hypothetical protein